MSRTAAVNAVTDAAPIELLSPLADWTVRAFRYQEFKSLEPRTLRDLHDAPLPTRHMNFERELQWGVAILLTKSKLLKRFVELKQDLEIALLQGTEAECFEILDRIENELGPSLWCISIRLALLQVFKGIEAPERVNDFETPGVMRLASERFD